VQLKKVGDRELLIVWNDGQRRAYWVRELRESCPCATCREKRSQESNPAPLLPILRDSELRPLSILGMKPVGNYAYAIQFSDGHDTGIYTFELLRRLGRVASDGAST
jgi:DUF971 family protein